MSLEDRCILAIISHDSRITSGQPEERLLYTLLECNGLKTVFEIATSQTKWKTRFDSQKIVVSIGRHAVRKLEQKLRMPRGAKICSYYYYDSLHKIDCLNLSHMNQHTLNLYSSFIREQNHLFFLHSLSREDRLCGASQVSCHNVHIKLALLRPQAPSQRAANLFQEGAPMTEVCYRLNRIVRKFASRTTYSIQTSGSLAHHSFGTGHSNPYI